MVLIANDDQDGYFLLTPDPDASPPSVPVFSVPLSTYNSISTAIQLGAMLVLQLQAYTLPSGAHVPQPPKHRAGSAPVTHFTVLEADRTLSDGGPCYVAAEVL